MSTEDDDTDGFEASQSVSVGVKLGSTRTVVRYRDVDVVTPPKPDTAAAEGAMQVARRLTGD